MTAKKSSPKSTMGFWQMLNNVLIASMNKGQFPVAIAGLIATMIIWKLPPADVSTLVLRLLDGLENHWLIGDIVGLCTSVGWFVHSRYQRRIITIELERVGRERTKLQEKLLNHKLSSSEDRK